MVVKLLVRNIAHTKSLWPLPLFPRHKHQYRSHNAWDLCSVKTQEDLRCSLSEMVFCTQGQCELDIICSHTERNASVNFRVLFLCVFKLLMKNRVGRTEQSTDGGTDWPTVAMLQSNMKRDIIIPTIMDFYHFCLSEPGLGFPAICRPRWCRRLCPAVHAPEADDKCCI